ncbi:recombination mediator RecR [Acidithiobacillus sulfuriphilus]|uniref:Recombination protein RecR n=2 Tax=Acidithiobacillus sulfuriphilus TaxID=1867749 RepID=A0A3M8QW29_9PROT|nr:recombination mediator RecR [Acidithiobacillus sulfuriphilus]RNF60468.1 recombination protein RecR [Acidithiobacillus sulfuriphilus]
MFGIAAVDELVSLLRRLPGIGPRSAQRISFELLVRKRELMPLLAAALLRANGEIRHCQRCNNLADADLCAICRSDRRDHGVLCVVESPADVLAIEATGIYNGDYFVLMGHLSPLDGIGPEALHLERFAERIALADLREVILATNPTVEGEATAHFLGGMMRREGVAVSRIARGVPVGGELEYVDRGTLGRALTGRRALED